MGASIQSEGSRPSILLRAVRLSLAPLALVIGVGVAAHCFQANRGRTILEQSEAFAVKDVAAHLTCELEPAISDLMVLSSGQWMVRALSEPDDSAARAALAREFLVYSANRTYYDQIRLLDETGDEVIRVNHNGGRPYVVDPDGLQHRAARYFFRDVIRLARREVYVSRLDLTVEQGRVEEPHKPVIRLGTPVFDQHGDRRGVLLLNYDAAPMLDQLAEFSGSGWSDLALLNAEGYWLKGPRAEDEWGFMYPDRKDRTFGHSYPDEWQAVRSGNEGQLTTEAGLFTFAAVTPFPLESRADSDTIPHYAGWTSSIPPEDHRWIVVSQVPARVLGAMDAATRRWTTTIIGLLTVVLGGASWRLARAQVRREHAEKVRLEAEQRFRLASKCASDLIYDWDITNGSLEWFGDIDGALGCEPGRFPRTLDAWFVRIHPDDQPALEECLRHCREGRESVDIEYRIRHENGAWLVWRDRGTIVRDELGKPVRLIGACDDVTEHKQAEARRAWDVLADQIYNKLFRVSLEAGSSEELAKEALDVLLDIDFLRGENKGAIFLVEETTNGLVRVAQRNLAKPLGKLCDRVPRGYCLCGRAAATGDIQFASCLDDRHDVRFDGMESHGHYCVPIKAGAHVVGVMVFYLPAGAEWRQPEVDLLKNAADILSSALQRLSAEQELKHQIRRVSESKRRLEILVSNTTDREKRMVELKHEINELLLEAGRTARYEAPGKVAALAAGVGSERAG